MASSCTNAFLKSAVQIFHCLLQHLSWDTVNFILNSLFELIQSSWSSRVHFTLEIAPQEKNHKRTNLAI